MDLEFSPSRVLLMGFLFGATQASAMEPSAPPAGAAEETRMVKKLSGTDLDLRETKDFTKQDKTLEVYALKARAGKPLVVWKVGTTENPAAYVASGKDKEKRAALDKLLVQPERRVNRLSCYTLAAPDAEFARDDEATALLNLRVARAYVDQIRANSAQGPEVVNATLALVDRLNSDPALKNAVASDLARLQSEMADLQGSDAITSRAAEFLGNAINSAQLNAVEAAMAQYRLALLRAKSNDHEGAIGLLGAAIRSGNLDHTVVPEAIRELTVAKYKRALALANSLYGDPAAADPRVGENRQRALFEDVLIAGDQVQPDQLAVAKYYLAGLCLKAENIDVNRARDLFKEAVDSGKLDPDKLADAQLQLAVLYAGAGDAQLQSTARELFERVIASGHANEAQLALARYNLADMYFAGRGGEKAIAGSLELFEAVHEDAQLTPAQRADAKFRLALFCGSEENPGKDTALARGLFETALNLGLIDPSDKAVAQYELACLYANAPVDAHNDAQARDFLDRTIKSGHISSQLSTAKYKLAKLLEGNRGGAADLTRARALYEEAIAGSESSVLPAAELVNAQYNLALMCARGQGGKQDDQRAKELLDTALKSDQLPQDERSFALSMFSYLADPNHALNRMRAEEYEMQKRTLERPVQGSVDRKARAQALFDHALKCDLGETGSIRMPIEARECFDKLIAEGDAHPKEITRAKYRLALLCEDPQAGLCDSVRARTLLEQVLDFTDRRNCLLYDDESLNYARYRLAILYATGRGGNVELNRAHDLLEQACRSEALGRDDQTAADLLKTKVDQQIAAASEQAPAAPLAAAPAAPAQNGGASHAAQGGNGNGGTCSIL